MCVHYNIEKFAKLKKYYPKTFRYKENTALIVNAYAHPSMPIILSETPKQVDFFKWGLIPTFTNYPKDAETIAKMTINARIETVDQLKSFRPSIEQKRKCIIPATSFFEWQHKEKKKIKFKIEHSKEELFFFAGIWSIWINPKTKDHIKTFSILTCDANSLMSEIHNVKKRMPIILSNGEEARQWLNKPMNKDILINISHNQNLKATQVLS